MLRSSTANHLDDLQRAVDNGVNIFKQMVKDQRMVAGGGACELRLASHLNALAAKTPGLEQYAIKKYAEAFETIPRTLAENAGQDTTSTVSDLYAAHTGRNASPKQSSTISCSRVNTQRCLVFSILDVLSLL